MEVEKIALQINKGEIEAVMSLELKPNLLEQAQLVAELMESGELILDDRRKMEISGEKTGVKRYASAMAQSDNEAEIEENSSQQKEKRISLVQFCNNQKIKLIMNFSLFQKQQLLMNIFLPMLR